MLSMLRLTMRGVIVTGTHFRRVTRRTLVTTNPAGTYTRRIVRIRLNILFHYLPFGIEDNFRVVIYECRSEHILVHGCD